MAGPAAFDLLVVGGGINGAGIARDAAMRGLRVCIVEANDWGWGTSARSSMLAHGGLRYLEQFELGLVHEALQDREIMFQHAPHLVRPLEFIYPLYPHIASRRTVRAGLFLYDILSHGKSVPKRDYLPAADVKLRLPGINPDQLKGGATYYDGQWRSVERFVTELIVSALRHGATCLHHTRVERLMIEDGVCVGAVVRPDIDEAWAAADEALGESTEEGHVIRAKAVINAAGPWVDELLDGAVQSKRLIRGTKGVHIVVPRFVDTALIIRAQDGRTFFILPWQEHCVVGTTDTDFEGDPGDARATADEVAYLQDAAGWYFPDAPLDQVRWTYGGVRPLVYQDALTEGNVTRRHILHDHAGEGAARLWSIQGGKLTTYRHLAEEAVDAVAQAIGQREALKQHPTRTGTLPGGPLTPWSAFRRSAVDAAMADHDLDAAAAQHLVDTYGARWRPVVESGDATRIVKDHATLWCEIDHAVLHEQGHTVADVLLRRTQLGFGDGGRIPAARRVARHMGTTLGWGAKRVKAELQRYEDEVARLAVPKP